MKNIDFSRFECPDGTRQNKVVTLEQAIAGTVKPGMGLHLCVGQTNANAAICEIARQFWGTRPDFTVYSMLFYQHGISLVFGGLVKKLVAAFIGDSYPTGSPSAVIRKAHGSGELEIESWSILTYIERFMAGAMGLPFLPTKSLYGSGMLDSGNPKFHRMKDPFGDGDIGLVSAVRPDLSFVHAHAADPFGNLIGVGPGAEGVWGAMAAKNGVVATVEKIVSPEFVREHSSLVRIPGYKVKAVAEAPFGSHPRGITNQGYPDLATYYDDFEFLMELREAYRKEDSAKEWVDKWILGCKSHADYLGRLGQQRLDYLQKRTQPGAWRETIDAFSEDKILAPTFNLLEMMAVQSAREIRDKSLRNDYRILLAGVGVSNLAAWTANQMLNQAGHSSDVVAEFGFFGYTPCPGDASIHKIDNLQTATMMTDALQILGIHAAGSDNHCIGVLGAAQVDKYGNINSTLIPGKTYLVGSGGANDVASGAQEVVVVMAQEATRLVDEVPFITCPGAKIKMLVTDIGVFEKTEDSSELVLTRVLPTSDAATLESQVELARRKCSWELAVSPHVSMCPKPDAGDLAAVRLFDPNGYFIGT